MSGFQVVCTVDKKTEILRPIGMPSEICYSSRPTSEFFPAAAEKVPDILLLLFKLFYSQLKNGSPYCQPVGIVLAFFICLSCLRSDDQSEIGR